MIGSSDVKSDASIGLRQVVTIEQTKEKIDIANASTTNNTIYLQFYVSEQWHPCSDSLAHTTLDAHSRAQFCLKILIDCLLYAIDETRKIACIEGSMEEGIVVFHIV